MVVCIDIDGTITEPFYYLERANHYFGVYLMPEDIRHYEVDLNYGVSRQAYLDFYRLFGDRIHFEAKPRAGAAQVLNRISEFDEIHYVTARAPEMLGVSRKWLESNGFPKGGIHCLGSHHKVEKARELSCDIFFEDRKENAIELAFEGFEVVLMDCPYNQGDLAGVRRVGNWMEASLEVQKLSWGIKMLQTA
ncbi:MAG TPA: hypothetical protein VJ990_10720 [Clostridia bacterium]|nr:hypothetical protein [Clostridia bacterium]